LSWGSRSIVKMVSKERREARIDSMSNSDINNYLDYYVKLGFMCNAARSGDNEGINKYFFEAVKICENFLHSRYKAKIELGHHMGDALDIVIDDLDMGVCK